MARSTISTRRSGETVIDGRVVGQRKFIIKANVSFSKDEELILNASSKEDCEEKLQRSMEGRARQLGMEVGAVFVDFCMDMEEFAETHGDSSG